MNWRYIYKWNFPVIPKLIKGEDLLAKMKIVTRGRVSRTNWSSLKEYCDADHRRKNWSAQVYFAPESNINNCCTRERDKAD